MKSQPATAGTEGHGRSAERLRLTTEGLVWTGLALALGVLAWVKSLNLVLILAYGMGVLLVLNGVLAWMQVRRIVLLPNGSSPVFAREATRVGVRVRNTGPRPVTAAVSEGDAEWSFDRLAPGREVECTSLRTFPQRGFYPINAFAVWSGYPFGLIRYERASAGPATLADSIAVLPEVGEADAEGLRRWVLRQVEGEGRARKSLRRITPDQSDVRGVRPYRSGDSIRTVHWRTSARRRSLFVREFDSAPSPELVVVVEPWLPIEATADDRAALEAALSLAATVVRTWVRAFGTHAALAIAVEGTPFTRLAVPNDESARCLLIPLADLGGTDQTVPPRLDDFDHSIRHGARVVVSSRPATPLADELARIAGRPFVALDARTHYPWYQPPSRTSEPARPMPLKH